MIAKIRSFLFENKTARQTVAKNTFWLAVSQLGSRLIRAAIIIYAARVLGAAEYGLFSYVLGFAGFFTIFSDIGVGHLLTRDTARHPDERPQYFSNSFWAKITLLALTAVLIIFIAPHITNIEMAKALVPLVAILVIADGLREFSIAFLRGMERMETEAFIVTIMNVTIMAAGFAILAVQQTARALLYSYIASVVAAAVLAVLILRRYYGHIFRYVSIDRIRYIVKTSWPIAFSSMLGIFMLNTDMVMLGWWRTAEEIGYYAVGQRIIQVLYTLPALLASATFPMLSRLVKEQSPRERDLNETSMTMIYLAALPLAMGGIIVAPDLIELVFGPQYLPAVLSFRILLLTPLLAFPAILLSNLVVAHNQQRPTLKYVAVGAGGNIIFNAVLIPLLGIMGAAIATLVAQLLNYGLIWRHMKKMSDFHTLRYLKKTAIAVSVMGIATILLKYAGVHVAANITISAIIYFALLWKMKEKTLLEMKSMVPLLNRL